MRSPFGLPGAGPIHRFEAREALGWLPRGYIDGGICANDGTDAVNDISVAAFACKSTVNIVDGAASTLDRDQLDLGIPVSVIKQFDITYGWENYDPDSGRSGGGRSGIRSTSALADGTWHILAVGAKDRLTGLVAHDSLTQSAILTELKKLGFTGYRNIMSVVRAASIKAFKQYDAGLVIWSVPVFETVGTAPDTTQRNYALTVPTGINGMAVDCAVDIRTSAGQGAFISGHPDQTLAQPSTGTTLANPFDTAYLANVNHESSYARAWRAVNASAQIAVRSAAATTAGYITTFGYRHPRGRDA